MTDNSKIFICGIDEAGRGPLAGPVVTACVIFNPDVRIKDVRDSKKLSEKKRESLYDEIIEKSLEYKIEIIDNIIIDEINILNATMLGMEKCITSLKFQNFKLMVDGNYFKLKNNIQRNFDFDTIVKGDEKIFEISCASILAKVTRDRIMRKYEEVYPGYNFIKNKGYGTKQHINSILKLGLCKIHRTTFCKNFIQYGFENF